MSSVLVLHMMKIWQMEARGVSTPLGPVPALTGTTLTTRTTDLPLYVPSEYLVHRRNR